MKNIVAIWFEGPLKKEYDPVGKLAIKAKKANTQIILFEIMYIIYPKTVNARMNIRNETIFKINGEKLEIIWGISWNVMVSEKYKGSAEGK